MSRDEEIWILKTIKDLAAALLAIENGKDIGKWMDNDLQNIMTQADKLLEDK